MGLVLRQSIKSVIVTIGGILLGAMVTMFSARFFPKAELGFTLNLIKIALLVSYLGSFGLNFTILILGQKYPPGHKARGTFLSICTILPLIFTTITTILYFLFKEQLLGLYQGEDALMMRKYFILFPLLTFSTVLLLLLEGYLQSINKTAAQNFGREVLLRIFYLSLIFAYGFDIINFTLFIWLYVIIHVIPFVYLLVVSLKSKVFYFEWKKNVFSVSEIKEFIRFGGYHMLTSVSSVLILQLDSLLLAPLAEEGFEAVAVYSIAALAISMLRNPLKVIGFAVIPTYSKAYQEGRIDDLKNLFIKSRVNGQIYAVLASALIIININNIGTVMSFIQVGYEAVQPLILILMIGQFVEMMTGFNFELIGVTKYYRFNFWIALFLVGIILVLNLLFIQKYGIYGAAWATSIGIVLFNLIKSYYLWKKLKFPPFSKSAIYILSVGAILIILTWFIPFVNNVYMDIFIRSTLFVSLFWFLMYKLNISEELNKTTLNIIKNKRLF